jgi:branched-subunit amino acid aminotransferase/4-amino-4-deoxychorismate lyase
MLAAEEAFTTSSVREVMPVVEVDGVRLERGPAADALQQTLRKQAGR